MMDLSFLKGLMQKNPQILDYFKESAANADYGVVPGFGGVLPQTEADWSQFPQNVAEANPVFQLMQALSEHDKQIRYSQQTPSQGDPLERLGSETPEMASMVAGLGKQPAAQRPTAGPGPAAGPEASADQSQLLATGMPPPKFYDIPQPIPQQRVDFSNTLTPQPQPEAVPEQDYSRLMETLDQYAPVAPEPTNKNEMWIRLLAGLARGASAGLNTSPDRQVASVISGAGAGGAEAYLAGKDSDAQALAQYEQDRTRFGFGRAGMESRQIDNNSQIQQQNVSARNAAQRQDVDSQNALNVAQVQANAQVDSKNIEQENLYRMTVLENQMRFEKENRPKIVSDANGIRIITTDLETGDIRVTDQPSYGATLDQLKTRSEILKNNALAALGGTSRGKSGTAEKLFDINDIPGELLARTPALKFVAASAMWAKTDAGRQAAQAILLRARQDPDLYGGIGMALEMASPKEQMEWAEEQAGAERFRTYSAPEGEANIEMDMMLVSGLDGISQRIAAEDEIKNQNLVNQIQQQQGPNEIETMMRALGGQ